MMKYGEMVIFQDNWLGEGFKKTGLNLILGGKIDN